MKLIVCLDDNGGMMFNNRRQSRDRILIEDIIRMTNGSRLYIAEYSKILFEGNDANILIDDCMLDVACEGDFCFVENKPLSDRANEAEEIIIYRWNRRYPYDLVFDVDLEKEGFALIASYEFAGYSHEKITKEIYRR